jgi:hypothetical protein
VRKIKGKPTGSVARFWPKGETEKDFFLFTTLLQIFKSFDSNSNLMMNDSYT